MPLPVRDTGDLDADLRAEYARPFDLEHGPLLRCPLLRESGTAHVLPADGPSHRHGRLVDGRGPGRAVHRLRALAPGSRPDLPAPATQYPDFAVWQRRRLSGTRLDEQLAHWKEKLAGAVAPELPWTGPGAARRPPRAPCTPSPSPAALTTRLRDLAREQPRTLHTALVAVTQALLAPLVRPGRHHRRLPDPGRSRTDLERTVGFFVKTVVLRTPVDASGSFRELLARAAGTVGDAFAHGDTPFERIVEAVGAPREAGRNPLFDVMVLLHPDPPAATAPRGLATTPVTVPRQARHLRPEHRVRAGRRGADRAA